MAQRDPIDRTYAHGTLRLVQGDIVTQQVDAIVNAANSALAGGGGVDGAIHRAAGRRLLEACLALPTDANGQRCPPGQVRITDAFDLSVGWVIHGVGPVFDARQADACRSVLRSVVRNALTAASELGARSVAFPAISTGVYRFPLDEAGRIHLDEAVQALQRAEEPSEVRFVLFDERAFDAFASELAARRD
ncbi:MAG: macro domain-containing protein [Myxococcales bacterium]|nr:macro domain-containing protein [Myxococcales bacterium]